MQDQDMIDSARKEYLKFLPTLLVAYPKLSSLSLEELKSLPCVAIISRSTVKTDESLRDYIARQLNETHKYSFNADNNFVVAVPMESVGSLMYAVFEIEK